MKPYRYSFFRTEIRGLPHPLPTLTAADLFISVRKFTLSRLK